MEQLTLSDEQGKELFNAALKVVSESENIISIAVRKQGWNYDGEE